MTLLGSAVAAAGETGAYVADERLYLDKDGEVVGEDDPTRVELLVGVGGTVPRARAITLGLIEVPDASVAQQSDDETMGSLQAPPPPADKAAADKAAADKAAADAPLVTAVPPLVAEAPVKAETPVGGF